MVRLGVAVLLILMSACSEAPDGDAGADALPKCDRQHDTTPVTEAGCLVQTANALGYSGVPANSFHLAYRICFDTDFEQLAEKYSAGTGDPQGIADSMAAMFDNADSQSAGSEACMLALGDQGHT